MAKYAIAGRKFYLKHKEEERIRNIETNHRLRKMAISILGSKCVRCGFMDTRALQVDHINGNGKLEKKAIKRRYFKAVIDSILAKENKYQLLCANCNWIKRVENNEIYIKHK
jgi:hypothetical protein